MKGKKAKVNKIFSATACLAVSLAFAVFTCLAWFVNNGTVQSGVSASLSEGNICDLTATYYSLISKAGGTSSYTVSEELTAEEDGGVLIGSYGSTGSTSTLIKVTYTVKDGSDTKLIFAGSGDATFPATTVETEDPNNEGLTLTTYHTSLSNAVSLRLADDVSATNGFPSSASSSNGAKTFCDVSELDDAVSETGTDNKEHKTITKNNVVFSDITASGYGEQNSSGYYEITVYIIMEYSEENVAALYGTGVSYSNSLVCSKDLTLTAKPNDGTDDAEDPSGSDSSGGTSSSEDSSSEDSSGGSSSSEDSGTTETDNYSFSYTELTSAISAAGVTLTDSMAVTQSYLTGSNSFLNVVDGGTVTVRDGSSTAKTCIEIKNSALSVTFKGTGTITISFASTGNTNTSDLGLEDSNGSRLTATKTEGNITQSTNYDNLYLVYGTTYCTITFTITEAGTYTLVSGIEYSRNTRINAITMTDTYTSTQ